MALNILYVQTDAQDNTAQIGNPLKPYTLSGAIDYANSTNQGGLVFLHLSPGVYNLGCPNKVFLTNNMIITGRDFRSTIINVYQFEINNSADITFQNVSIRTCQTGVLFKFNTGVLTISSSEIISNIGTLFESDDGSLVVNGSVINITSTTPSVNFSRMAVVITNSNFNFRIPDPIMNNLSLIGTNPRQGSITLQRVEVNIETNGGIGIVVPFYNIGIINNSVVKIKGTKSEGFILYATDALPGVQSETLIPVTPYYLINITVHVRDLQRAFSVSNPNNYPLVIKDLAWSGIVNPPNYGQSGVGLQNIDKSSPGNQSGQTNTRTSAQPGMPLNQPNMSLNQPNLQPSVPLGQPNMSLNQSGAQLGQTSVRLGIQNNNHPGMQPNSYLNNNQPNSSLNNNYQPNNYQTNDYQPKQLMIEGDDIGGPWGNNFGNNGWYN